MNLKQFKEIIYILIKVSYYIFLSFLDYIKKFFKTNDSLGKPLHWYLSSNNLSLIIKKNIQNVEINKIHGNRLNDTNISDGLGSGTSYCWLQAKLLNNNNKDNKDEILNLFVKIPAPDFFKSMFLTIFGVYANELNFYENILNTNAIPDDICPKVFYAKMRRTQFTLILDDILAKNVECPTILDVCTKERATLIIKTLARLHSVNWNNPPKSIWNDQNRPAFCTIIAITALKNIQKKYSNQLIPSNIEQSYLKFIDNYDKIRKHWSSEVLTLIHGDTHLGNMHFYPLLKTTTTTTTTTSESTPKMGFHDWQCVAQEHGMRDIGYFLLSSIDSNELEANDCKLEKYLLELYMNEVNSYLTKKNSKDLLLNYSEILRLYRELSWWTFTAWLISAGTADLMPDLMVKTSLARITRGMLRINSIEALNNMLK